MCRSLASVGHTEACSGRGGGSNTPMYAWTAWTTLLSSVNQSHIIDVHVQLSARLRIAGFSFDADIPSCHFHAGHSHAASVTLLSPVKPQLLRCDYRIRHGTVQAWHGVIAGSAPIWAFEGEHPPIDPNYFAKGVTYDTTEAAGAAPGCTTTLRSAWAALISLAEGSDGGLADASDALNICPHRRLNTTADAYSARGWAASAFDMMAMGNYPFESGYMLNGQGLLPAFPVRVACKALMDTYTAERTAVPLTPVAPVRRPPSPLPPPHHTIMH